MTGDHSEIIKEDHSDVIKGDHPPVESNSLAARVGVLGDCEKHEYHIYAIGKVKVWTF